MLKSIGVVPDSYVLSIVLVVATDPLLSRLFPGDFVKGHVPSNAALLASTGFFCSGVNPVRVGMRALCSQPASHACAVVLHRRRIDGRRSYDSQLEQGMAHWYWLSWLLTWPVSCWIGLLLGARRTNQPSEAVG